jgi:hypothetical protein
MNGEDIVKFISSKDKMAGSCKVNRGGASAKKDGGRKTVYRKKKRKTLFEMDGEDERQRAVDTGC